jgi:hypothetical protein
MVTKQQTQTHLHQNAARCMQADIRLTKPKATWDKYQNCPDNASSCVLPIGMHFIFHLFRNATQCAKFISFPCEKNLRCFCLFTMQGQYCQHLLEHPQPFEAPRPKSGAI